MIDLIFTLRDLRNTLLGVTLFPFHNINPLLVFISVYWYTFQLTWLYVNENSKDTYFANVKSCEETFKTR